MASLGQTVSVDSMWLLVACGWLTKDELKKRGLEYGKLKEKYRVGMCSLGLFRVC